MPPEVLFDEAAKVLMQKCIHVNGESILWLLNMRFFPFRSTGIMPPEVLFDEAAKVLMQKAADLGQLLKDAVVGQGGVGVPDGGVQWVGSPENWGMCI